MIYSLVETARLNVYCYMEHLLTELPKLADDKGNIDTEKLEPLLPWSKQLPAQCQNPAADEKISGDFYPPGE